MQRRAIVAGMALLGLAACGRGPVGSTATAAGGAFRITPEMEAEIGYRMADSVNTLRQAAGVGPVRLDAALTAAAATHSRDMAVQNRPWHFGSDGSSPVDRLARVGYRGRLSWARGSPLRRSRSRRTPPRWRPTSRPPSATTSRPSGR